MVLLATEAIRQAAPLRFRPIMMTTMAALLGGVPPMLSHGTGSELRQPLGHTMVGGLLVRRSDQRSRAIQKASACTAAETRV